MEKPIIAGIMPKAVDLKEGSTYYFCTCGQSQNQPFCDGAHSGTEFSPKAFKADKTGTAYLCMCKVTDNSPFCDGSHSKFSESQIGQKIP